MAPTVAAATHSSASKCRFLKVVTGIDLDFLSIVVVTSVAVKPTVAHH